MHSLGDASQSPPSWRRGNSGGSIQGSHDGPSARVLVDDRGHAELVWLASEFEVESLTLLVETPHRKHPDRSDYKDANDNRDNQGDESRITVLSQEELKGPKGKRPDDASD